MQNYNGDSVLHNYMNVYCITDAIKYVFVKIVVSQYNHKQSVNLNYGASASFRGGSSFHGIPIFHLKLYFLTSCQVCQRLAFILCKKNNKDCFNIFH